MLDMTALTALCAQLGCACLAEEPLSKHTSFQVGGACRAFVSVNSVETVRSLVAFLNEYAVPFTVLGRGSNIIAADEGYDGVIIGFGAEFSHITLEGGYLTCEAGASLKDVCLFALEHSLGGLEFAYGIPGSAGGALYMNAGAYGGEMDHVVYSAEVLEQDGTIRTIEREDLALSYRHSRFMEQGGIILSVTLALELDEPHEIRGRMDDYMNRRRTKQPLEYPSAGSTFKRPEGDFASRLIEVCGLKGRSVGGAQVSEKHSGFVINTGGATCADILALAEVVQREVEQQTGFRLELEPVLLK